MPNAPLKHVSGSTVTTVIDPRFGTGATPTQPAGWGGTGGGGSTGTYSGGVRGKGFHIPPGGLDNLTAALANMGTDQRVEIAYLGDSTGYGSGQLLGGPPRKLRSLLLAAGVADGGRGAARGGDATWGGDYTDLVARTGWADSAPDYMFHPSFVSAADGDVVTLQGYGTAIRVRAWNMAGLSYQIDGGATVTPPSGAGITVAYSGGLTEGLHTITVTKVGTSTTGFGVEFIRDAGIVVHQDSRSGATAGYYYDYRVSDNGMDVGNNTGTQIALGLTSTKGTSKFDWRTTPASAPVARSVRAAVFALGINDQDAANNAGETDVAGMTAAAILQENVAGFIRLCRAGQIDPIVVVPHLEDHPGAGAAAGRFQSAIVAAAESMSATWCDYNMALRLAGFTQGNGPHISQVGYDIEAQFLFDNIISRALPE